MYSDDQNIKGGILILKKKTLCIPPKLSWLFNISIYIQYITCFDFDQVTMTVDGVYSERWKTVGRFNLLASRWSTSSWWAGDPVDHHHGDGDGGDVKKVMENK